MNKLLQRLLRTPPVASGATAPQRYIHHEQTQNDFNIRIIKAANGHIIHGNKHDGHGNTTKEELHIVTPDEDLMGAVAKVVVAMQLG